MKRLLPILLLLLSAVAHAQLPSGYTPCAVSDMKGEWKQEGDKNNVVLTFTTPTQASKYDMSLQDYVFIDMDADISKVVVQRITDNFNTIVTVAVIETPGKGEALKFTDEDMQYGSYMYRAIVYVGAVHSNEWDWTAIKTVIVGQIPADFGDEDVSAKIDGNKVTLSYKIPEVSSLGEPLVMDVNCTVSEMTGSEPPTYVDLATQKNVTPGQKYTYVIENARNGSHTYCFQASTLSGVNNGTYRYCINVFVGQDVPGQVRNAKAKLTDDGVVVTWNTPVRGQNGGDMGDPSLFTYNIIRKTSIFDGGGVSVASGISELSFTDHVSSTKETTYLYEIMAVNSVGEGPGMFTNSVFVGNATDLPYTDNFDSQDVYGNISFDRVWQKDYSGYYCSWYTTGGGFYINDKNPNVQPHNGEGLAYAMYSNWGTTDKWDALTSGHINFSEAEYPVLTLWIYDINNGGSDMTLSIQAITESINETTEAEIHLGEADEDGWVKHTVLLPSLRNVPSGQIRLRTDAHGSKCYAVVIDELLVENNESIYTGIGVVKNEGTVITDGKTYSVSGQLVSPSYSGIVIKDGKKYIRK